MLSEVKSDEEVAAIRESKKSWAWRGHSLDVERSWIQPGHWKQRICKKPMKMRHRCMSVGAKEDVQVEEYEIEDAEVVIAA